MPHPLALIATLAWGVLSGWVATWVVHRFVEAEDSDFAEFVDARCDHCSEVLTFADVSPHEAWACPHCSESLGRSWPITFVAVVAGCVSMLFAPFGESLVVIPFLWLVPVLVIAAAIDLRTFLIPRKVAWVGFFVGLASIVAIAAVLGEIASVQSALIGAAMLFGFLFLTHMIYPRGMGFGDVRFSLLLGLYLGWIDIRLPIWGLLIACILGVAMGVIRRVTASKDDENAAFFPFGPGLVAGTLVALWFFPTFLPG
jgi:leader peptidase (prepilin peptidase)/N-methyltransferase